VHTPPRAAGLPEMAVILDARGLHKSFGAVTAASNINVAIERDSVVGLIGTNGAGKTTFINMITGYLKPDAGSIHYEERDITQLAPREITRLRICRSFQIPQLYQSLSVYENMLAALGVILHNAGLGGFFSRGQPQVPGHDATAEVVAERTLERFGLTPYRDQNAQGLPGGVRKLLDIALTIVARPQILLLDEPTSGVSSDEKFGIMEMVLKVARDEGATVLFVEHDMEIVNRYAERVLAFYDGRVIADAPPAIALNDPEVKRYVVGGSLQRLDDDPGAANA
jgi:branched-chain amino acid transport system ATP-binding protein